MKHLKPLKERLLLKGYTIIIGLVLLGAVPLIADVLVGVTDNGGLSNGSTDPACTKRTGLITGTATVIKARTGNDFGTSAYTMAVYASDGTHPTGGPRMQSSATTTVTTADTVYDSNGLTCTVSCAIVASTEYFVCVWNDNGQVELSDAVGDVGQLSLGGGETHPTWPTWNDATSFAFKFDVWVEGTASSTGQPAALMSFGMSR